MSKSNIKNYLKNNPLSKATKNGEKDQKGPKNCNLNFNKLRLASKESVC